MLSKSCRLDWLVCSRVRIRSRAVSSFLTLWNTELNESWFCLTSRPFWGILSSWNNLWGIQRYTDERTAENRNQDSNVIYTVYLQSAAIGKRQERGLEHLRAEERISGLAAGDDCYCISLFLRWGLGSESGQSDPIVPERGRSASEMESKGEQASGWKKWDSWGGSGVLGTHWEVFHRTGGCQGLDSGNLKQIQTIII